MADTDKTPAKKPLTLSSKLNLKDIEERKAAAEKRSGSKTVVVEVKKGKKSEPTPPAGASDGRMRGMKIDLSQNKTHRSEADAAFAPKEAEKQLTEQERQARLEALKDALSREEQEKIREQERLEREAEAAKKAALLKQDRKEDNQKASEPLDAEPETAQVEPDILVVEPQPVKIETPKHHRRAEEDEEDTKRRSAASRDDRSKPQKPSSKYADTGRRTGRMTVHDAFKDPEEGRRQGRRYKSKDKKPQLAEPPRKIFHEVVIPETITVQELSNRMAEPSGVVVKTLMKLGMMVTITQTIDGDTAQLVVEELGHTARRVSDEDLERQLLDSITEKGDAYQESRPPVVTVMGHVDHGKTSLLDAIRKADVVKGEAGGITQHIGAYQVTTINNQKITFIDTPGHAAFTQMRARGANVTDIVVLVVAADDGVKDQTIEAIRHAKAAGVPIIVAVNKIDKPEADPQRVRSELLNHEVIMEDLGGDVMSVDVSAKARTNIDKLEETILLQAEIMGLQANPHCSASGSVVEARLEKGRGAVATVLVQQGTLKVGDVFVAGAQFGKVRALFDSHGFQIQEATPSMPIEVIGFGAPPESGDIFTVVKDEAKAREIAIFRDQRRRAKVASLQSQAKLDNLFTDSLSGKKTLNVLVKADVQGSAEAIVSSLSGLGTAEVDVKTVHVGAGGISEADVSLARTSNALMIGFNVRANNQARDLASKEGVQIRYYDVIYNVINDVRSLMEGLLSPIQQEEFIGRAEVRQVFAVSKVGNIAGCIIKEGVVRRGAKVRLIRDDVVVHEGPLKTLKRFKDEVKEVKEGYECGIAFENYNDIREGDVIECSEVKEVKRTL